MEVKEAIEFLEDSKPNYELSKTNDKQLLEEYKFIIDKYNQIINLIVILSKYEIVWKKLSKKHKTDWVGHFEIEELEKKYLGGNK